jgi:outer membrane protein OmpA-like peptidoglycan-associated protein
LAGVSFGLAGTSTFVRELAPTTPYQLLGAISYDYDARPPEADVKVIERLVEIPLPPKGRVIGSVTVEGTGTPIAGAAIKLGNSALSPIMTKADGRFVSYELDPGVVSMEITHPEFQSGRCSAAIAEKGGDATIVCTLTPLPNESPLSGRIIDNWSLPVANASVSLSGAGSYHFATDQEGRFKQQVAPGQYSAQVEAAGYLARTDSFSVAPKIASSVEIALVEKPKVSKVSQRANVIHLGGDLSFARGSSNIKPTAAALLADLADFLQRNSQIRKVKIAGAAESGADNPELAYNRATAIKDQLVKYGVAPERLEPVAGNAPRVKITVE